MARILYCNNVCRLGGTMLFTRDISRAYPELDHCVLYLNEGENPQMLEILAEEGIDAAFCKKLTKQVVREIDPAIIVLNNTPGKAIEGEYPFPWLSQYTIISVHHNPTWPLVPADLDVFVSESVLAPYKNCMSRIKKWRIVPPCIDTSEYGRIARKRDYSRTPCNIGKLSNDNPKKFPQSLRDILDKVDNCQFTLVGGKQYYPGFNANMPEIGSKPVTDFYRHFDILVYKNCDDLVDSWCRVISEAMASGLPVVSEARGGPKEQIDHGENGFLCNTDDEFVEALNSLINDEELRRNIGLKAAHKAMIEFDIKKFRNETIDTVLRGVSNVL